MSVHVVVGNASSEASHTSDITRAHVYRQASTAFLRRIRGLRAYDPGRCRPRATVALAPAIATRLCRAMAADATGSGAEAAPSVEINGTSVPVTADAGVDVAKALASKQFTDWVDGLDGSLEVSAVHMQGIDMFGPRVGFLKFRANVAYNGVKGVPGIVFARGGAVAMLVVLECEGSAYSLLTKQPRVPVGAALFPEIPAGMLDGDGHFGGVAAKELQEETGMEFDVKELYDLTALAAEAGGLPAVPAGMYPSPGACDEFIRLFAARRAVTRAELEELEGKCTGLVHEGEVITLEVVPLDTLWARTADGKTLAALHLFEKLKALGKLW